MNDREKKLKKIIKVAIIAVGYALLLTAVFKIGVKITLAHLRAEEARTHEPKFIIARCVSDLSQKTTVTEDDTDLSACEEETQKTVRRTKLKDIAALRKHSREANSLTKSLSDKQYTVCPESEQPSISQP